MRPSRVDSTFGSTPGRHSPRLAYPQGMKVRKPRFEGRSSQTQSAPGELQLIASIRQRAGAGTRREVRQGIGDDCALLRLRVGEELAVTTDLSIAGRHFRLDWHPPEAVGHRTLARGLSDLAAMGARPVAAFLSLGVPAELTKARGNTRSWVHRFLEGLFALASAYDVPLAGGDLAESPLAVADIVLTGAVPQSRALLRRGARPGDRICVTGTLGGAAAGLAALGAWAEKRKHRSHAPKHIPAGLRDVVAPHLDPQPRVAQGLWLQRRGIATAALDISDGLSVDLAHLCEESGVAATIERDRLPVAPAATLEQALHGGEDYELLFTVRPEARLPRRIAGIPVTQIGEVTRPRSGHPAILLVDGSGATPLQKRGWQHFAEKRLAARPATK
jgi:thiamine-monophosphate kinase